MIGEKAWSKGADRSNLPTRLLVLLVQILKTHQDTSKAVSGCRRILLYTIRAPGASHRPEQAGLVDSVAREEPWGGFP